MTKYCGKCGAPIGDYNDYCNLCGTYYQPTSDATTVPIVEPSPKRGISRDGKTVLVISVVILLAIGGCLFAFTGHDATITAERTNNTQYVQEISLIWDGETRDKITLNPGQSGKLSANYSLNFPERSKTILVSVVVKNSNNAYSPLTIPQIVIVTSGETIRV